MLDEFVSLTASWHAAMEAGDARTANKRHDHIVLLLGEIEQAGKQGYLVENMESLSDAACLFVASRLDKQDPVAIRAYERLVLSRFPFISISAKWILKEV